MSPDGNMKTLPGSLGLQFPMMYVWNWIRTVYIYAAKLSYLQQTHAPCQIPYAAAWINNTGALACCCMLHCIAGSLLHSSIAIVYVSLVLGMGYEAGEA